MKATPEDVIIYMAGFGITGILTDYAQKLPEHCWVCQGERIFCVFELLVGSILYHGEQHTPSHIQIVWNLILEGISPIIMGLINFLESLLMRISVGHMSFLPTSNLW